MSVLFGVYNRKGGDAGYPSKRMLEALSYWQPDCCKILCEDGIALGHQMLWGTPESKSESLPDKKGSCIITIDARLDNREELISRLGLAGNAEGVVTDSELILEAYRKWGTDCPVYLLGDFGFAIWDEKEGKLFCARDHVGIKQLYYHVSESRFIFTNDLKAFDAFPELLKNINDDAVANYLILGELIDNRKTFFESIFKVPPAHTLVVTADSCDLSRYWHPESTGRVDFPDLESYVQRLRELLEDAVACRLRTEYPVVSHLSGGLDSSSIAVIAARRLYAKDNRLHTFNWVHHPESNKNLENYEWKNSRIIAERDGISLINVDLSLENVCSVLFGRDIAYGDTTRFWYEYCVREQAQKIGARTILSGWGGDEFATYHGQAYFTDLLHGGKIVRMFRELHLLVAGGSGSYAKKMAKLLYHHVFMPSIPELLFSYLKGKEEFRVDEFPFLEDEYTPVLENKIEDLSSSQYRLSKTIRAHMIEALMRGHLQSRIESWGSAAFKDRTEYSYPLLDKRIIELILSVPAEYLFCKSRGRYLFRLAAEGLLPEEILWSDAKIERFRVERLLKLTMEALKRILQGDEIWNFSSAYVDNRKLKNAIEKITVDQTSRNDVMMLVRMVSALSLIVSRKIR